LSSLIICSFVISFSKFLSGRNLDYWFLGSSEFVYIDISDGDYGGSFFSDRSFIIVGEFFLAALMYTAVVLYHGDDYWLFVMLRGWAHTYVRVACS
jgi:hypothetical protein